MVDSSAARWGRGQLHSACYDENYYQEHAKAGLNYLSYGYWQQQYARAVTDFTLQCTYDAPTVLDVGCACGAIVAGFRDTSSYSAVFGIDPSEHMIQLGRTEFALTDRQLFIGSATSIPIRDLSLINSGQVLEHIHDEMVDDMLAEFYSALRPGGRMFHNLAALKHGDLADAYSNDPTHINVQPVEYWAEKFRWHGFIFDVDAYDRFVRSPIGPEEGNAEGFYKFYPTWTSFTLLKRKSIGALCEAARS